MYEKLSYLVSLIFVLALVLANFANADLVGYWKFDEESGTVAADSAGGDNDGTLIGDGLEWTGGKSGGGLFFPGEPTDARVEFPTTGMSTSSGTVAMWAILSDPQPETQGRYFFGHTTQPQWNNRVQIYMQEGSTPSTLLDIGLGSSHQPVQIGWFYQVGVHQHQVAQTQMGQHLHHRRAGTAAAHHPHPDLLKPSLARFSKGQHLTIQPGRDIAIRPCDTRVGGR